MENAAQYGLFLTRDNMLVDTAAGTPVPPPDALMPPLTPEQLAALPRHTPEQTAGRVVKAADRAWSGAALLDAGLPGHASELAPPPAPGRPHHRQRLAVHQLPLRG